MLKTSGHYLTGRQASHGFPQGDILSGILFALYIQELESLVHKSARIISFADNIVIYYQHNNLDTCRRHISHTMALAHRWLWENGLQLPINKCSALIFTHHRIYNNNPLQLADFAIPIESEHKYLGLYLHNKFKWTQDFQKLSDKTNQYNSVLKSVVRRQWGADPSVALTFYRATMRANLDYGAHIFDIAPVSTWRV